jgi:tetratricopeptide (TPR) repeat protein
MERTRRFGAVAIGAAVYCALAEPARVASASPSADELVRQARSHEAAHEEDVAARRYTEALALDPQNADAWLGLGEVRVKLGEAAEAERVYQAALERIPHFPLALARRARVRWALGRHTEAEADLEAYSEGATDATAYRQLAEWFGVDGRTPAQLATWRKLLSMAADAGNPDAVQEAERMVRALVVLVDSADPAASPVDGDATRRGMARIATRAQADRR